VQLSDAKVSGLHCEIRLDDRGYRLRDLDSTNGTFVGGIRINDVYIQPGAQIAVGSTRMKFEPLGESVELEISERDRLGGMLGRSVKMRELFARLEKLAATDTTVLITGETGVGKELAAECVHDLSPRAKGPFVVVDCGAIPPTLIESELFGHERGAFTGATASYAGAFERAHGGTVFLDELGELPLAMQPKLLRVLEAKEVRRVGGQKTINVDIRIVAATNRDLGVEVNRGRFREDLFYRLAVARIVVPPLRERKEDIPLLIEGILATTPGGEGAYIAAETIDLMMKHDWPGNVRELRNVIERAVLLAEPPENAAQLRRAPAPQPPPQDRSHAVDHRVVARRHDDGAGRHRDAVQGGQGQRGRRVRAPLHLEAPGPPRRQHLGRGPRRRHRSHVDPQDAAPARPGEPRPRRRPARRSTSATQTED
jgi:transcriptional regulator with GAF, ATPase, and Fis domain